MSNQEHTALINRFYEAFSNKDYATMANSYHADASFQDEVFNLKGQEIGAMWHMLCERGKDMTMTYSVAEKQGQVVAHWEPIYTFSQTGNTVRNVIDASFEFKHGKIYRHRDNFNFWRWSRQALGIAGVLLGWSTFLQSKVKQQARRGLDDFIANNQ